MFSIEAARRYSQATDFRDDYLKGRAAEYFRRNPALEVYKGDWFALQRKRKVRPYQPMNDTSRALIWFGIVAFLTIGATSEESSSSGQLKDMNIERHGIILNTEKYEECVRFYSELFDLRIMFQLDDKDSQLTRLEFGDSYLMIEKYGIGKDHEKTISENATKLRFNVSDLNAMQTRLGEFGIEAQVNHFNWGSTINIHDPDGNRIGIRDEAGFRKQIDAYQNASPNADKPRG